MLKTAIYYYDLNNWHVDVVLFHQRSRPSSRRLHMGWEGTCGVDGIISGHSPTHPLFIIARHLKCKATILFYHPSLSIIMSLSSHQNDSELVHSTVILSLAGHHGSRFIKDLSHSLYAVQCAPTTANQSIHRQQQQRRRNNQLIMQHTRGEWGPNPPTAPQRLPGQDPATGKACL